MSQSEPPLLVVLFDALGRPPTASERVFVATPVPGFQIHRLAKDANGNPALLILAHDWRHPGFPPVRLEHLYVAHNLDCDINREDGTKESGRVTVIRCLDPDRTTHIYFLRVLQALLPVLGPAPTPQAVNVAVDRLVDLFQVITAPPKKATQGLWAELFVIAEARDPAVLIDTWHRDPTDLFDFNSGAHRVEVKSAAGQARRHHFSLAQLAPTASTRTVIGSVLVNRAGGGTTVPHLVDEIVLRLGSATERILRVYEVVAATVGANIWQASLESFDRQLARQTLAFFDSTEVPTVNPVLPSGVSNVHFTSDLTDRRTLSMQDLQGAGGLLAALLW